jgi:hypothetical protein
MTWQYQREKVLLFGLQQARAVCRTSAGTGQLVGF